MIHIVENASTAPGEVEACRAIADHRANVNFLYSDHNLGFAGAVNLALQAAPRTDTDWCWILNPDAQLLPGAFQQMKRAVLAHPRAIYSPLITTGDGSQQEVWFGGGKLDLARGRVRHALIAPGNPVTEASFITGAAMIVRSDVWNELKGFRDDLFMYWEDADFSRRAASSGYRLFVIRDCVVWHRVGGSSGDSSKSPLWYYFLARNRLIVCADSPWKAIYLVARSGGELPRMIRRAFKEPGSTIPRWRALYRGTLDGVLSVYRKRPVGGLSRL